MKHPLLLAGALCLVLGALSCNSMPRLTWSSETDTRAFSVSTSTRTGSSTATSVSTPPGSAARAALALPTGDPETSTVLLEKVAPRVIQAGAEFEYGIEITNLTDLSLESVVVRESIPAGMTVVSTDPKVSKAAAGSLEWNLGSLGPRSSKRIRLNATAQDPGTLTTCSHVTYDTGVCLQMSVIRPALKLVASTTTPTGTPCDTLEYRYVVSNTGSGTAANIVVDATLPAGVLTADGQSSIKKEVGDLRAGEAREITIQARAGRTGSLTHSALATADGGLTAKSENVTTVVTEPKLSIRVTGPENAFSGRNVDYELTVTNVGDGAAQNAVITASLPNDATFKAATDGGRAAGRTVEWALGTLAPNATSKVAVKVTGANGQLVVRGTAAADCAEQVTDSAATSVTGRPALMLEVIDLDDLIEVGSTVTYLIKVTNQGNGADKDVSIVCEIPENVSFVSASGVTRETVADRTVTFAPLASLTAKKEAEWRVVVRAESGADARFKVSMRSANMTSPLIETEATTYYD